MNKVVLTVKSVRVGISENGAFYTVTFNETFDGFVEKEQGVFTKEKVDCISFDARYMHYALINLVDGVDVLYTSKLSNDKAFEPCVIALLKGASFIIDREKFAQGDEYTTYNRDVLVHSNDGYSKNILAIEVAPKVQKLLDDIMDSVLSI